MTAVVVRPVTPVKCTSWCGDGSGHPDAEDAEDQGCYSAERRVDLTAMPIPGQGVRSTSHVTLHLYRDAYSDGTGGAFLEQPHIEVNAGDADPLRLSPDEARKLSAVLVELADAAELG